MSLVTALRGGTVIDATGAAPIPDAVLVIRDGRVADVGPAAQVAVPPGAEIIDMTGRFLIPGLMDANVHLVAARTQEVALEYDGRYHELALDGARLCLKYGVTTVFDTWGPAGGLTLLRDRINAGSEVGSRLFCAGNILGLGGPMSPDFWDASATLERSTVERINAQWEFGTGPDLACMSVAELGDAVSEYIETTGVDFVKYAATDHRVGMYHLLFSESAQERIIKVARSYGKRVQAHTGSVESLRIEFELGADLLQHGDVTARRPIPEDLLNEIVRRQTPISVMLATTAHQQWYAANAKGALRDLRPFIDANDRALIRKMARLLLMTDGFAFGPRLLDHPATSPGFAWDVPDGPFNLGRSHFHWLKAAIEREMAPMEALRSATAHVADAYGIGRELGTLEVGKIADIVVLSADPLSDVRAYGAIVAVFKDGIAVDRGALCADLAVAEDPGEYRPDSA